MSRGLVICLERQKKWQVPARLQKINEVPACQDPKGKWGKGKFYRVRGRVGQKLRPDLALNLLEMVQNRSEPQGTSMAEGRGRRKIGSSREFASGSPLLCPKPTPIALSLCNSSPHFFLHPVVTQDGSGHLVAQVSHARRSM